MLRRPTSTKATDTPFPYPTLCRSPHAAAAGLDDHVGHPRIPAIVAVGAALGKVRVAGRKAQFHPVGDDRDAVERRTERVDEADGRDLEAGAGVRDIIIRVESVAGDRKSTRLNSSH